MKRNVYSAQGRVLIEALKRRAMTYRDMLKTEISNSPWKRVAECLRDGEKIVKAQDRLGRTTWRVVEVRRPVV